jgi:hypothetical protein
MRSRAAAPRAGAARVLACVLSLCVLLRPADALYTAKGDVEILTEANFEGA